MAALQKRVAEMSCRNRADGGAVIDAEANAESEVEFVHC
jgi:hypothetical protein